MSKVLILDGAKYNYTCIPHLTFHYGYLRITISIRRRGTLHFYQGHAPWTLLKSLHPGPSPELYTLHPYHMYHGHVLSLQTLISLTGLDSTLLTQDLYQDSSSGTLNTTSSGLPRLCILNTAQHPKPLPDLSLPLTLTTPLYHGKTPGRCTLDPYQVWPPLTLTTALCTLDPYQVSSPQPLPQLSTMEKHQVSAPWTLNRSGPPLTLTTALYIRPLPGLFSPLTLTTTLYHGPTPGLCTLDPSQVSSPLTTTLYHGPTPGLCTLDPSQVSSPLTTTLYHGPTPGLCTLNPYQVSPPLTTTLYHGPTPGLCTLDPYQVSPPLTTTLYH